MISLTDKLLKWLLGVGLLVVGALLVVQTVRLDAAKVAQAKAETRAALAEGEVKRLVAESQEQARLAVDRAREDERLMNRNNARITDDLHAKQLASDRRAAGAERRLRDLAAAYARDRGRAAADDTAAGCSADAPPAARLSGETRADLVRLLREADDAVEQLTGLQAYAADVCLLLSEKRTPAE